jgi:hypothetical protein
MARDYYLGCRLVSKHPIMKIGKLSQVISFKVYIIMRFY